MASTHSRPFGAAEKHIVDADPSTAAGVAAPVGSIANLDTGLGAWIKTGAGDAAWTRHDVGLHLDSVVDVVVAVADAGGGATVSLCTVDLTDLSGAALAKVAVVLLVASDTLYHGLADPNANITLDTFTKGSALANNAGAGWWLLKTDASGQVSCNANNAADETVYFSAVTADGGVDAAASGVMVRGCVPDDATWAA